MDKYASDIKFDKETIACSTSLASQRLIFISANVSILVVPSMSLRCSAIGAHLKSSHVCHNPRFPQPMILFVGF